MTDTEQLHQDFLNDFTELLKKYNAIFEVNDYGDGYNSHRGDGEVKGMFSLTKEYV